MENEVEIKEEEIESNNLISFLNNKIKEQQILIDDLLVRVEELENN